MSNLSKEQGARFDVKFYRNSDRVWMSRGGESYGSVVPEMGRGELFHFLASEISLALAAREKEIRNRKKEVAGLIGEGVHIGLRKWSEHPRSMDAWRAISEMEDGSWEYICEEVAKEVLKFVLRSPKEEQPTMDCPSCGAEYEDFDGFGVLYCEKCGYCSHANITGNICEFCKKEVRSPKENKPKSVKCSKHGVTHTKGGYPSCPKPQNQP